MCLGRGVDIERERVLHIMNFLNYHINLNVKIHLKVAMLIMSPTNLWICWFSQQFMHVDGLNNLISILVVGVYYLSKKKICWCILERERERLELLKFKLTSQVSQTKHLKPRTLEDTSFLNRYTYQRCLRILMKQWKQLMVILHNFVPLTLHKSLSLHTVPPKESPKLPKKNMAKGSAQGTPDLLPSWNASDSM